MTMKRILWIVAALICVAIGYVLAQQIERSRMETRITALQTQQSEAIAQLRTEGDARLDALARTHGEILLQAFAAGITPQVVAGRHEGIEQAAVSLLHVPGIAGIHVLGLDGSVFYSSDAKLAATGQGSYRGTWALEATELTTRQSTRPEVLDIAIPITSAGTSRAVAWLEYDVAAVKATAAQLSTPPSHTPPSQ